MTEVLRVLDRLRHRIPFWWWIAYDGIVALVIVTGVTRRTAFWIGFGVLGIAVLIDSVEFLVKSPWARRRIS